MTDAGKPKKKMPLGRRFTSDNPHKFQKGKSGNPSGKRKDGTHPNELYRLGEMRLSALLEDVLARNDGEKAKQLADVLVTRALQGDPVAIKAVLERVDGPVERKLQISSTINQQVISLVEAPRPVEFQIQAEVVPQLQQTVLDEIRAAVAEEDEEC